MAGDLGFSMGGEADIVPTVTGGNNGYSFHTFALQSSGQRFPGNGFIIDAGTARITAEQVALFVNHN
jgi:hypothetical protein